MPRDLEAEFQTAVAAVIEEETGGDPTGGQTNDPNDPGGLTRWGISKRNHPQVNVANLTRDDAVAIYRTEYWQPLLPFNLSTTFQRIAFESAINEGLGKTKALLPAAKGQLAWFLRDRAMAYISDPNFKIYGRGWLARLFTEALSV